MFERAMLIGISTPTFILQTRLNTNILNEQAPKADFNAIKRYDLYCRGHYWENRKPATGLYNCFGLVWANRRTSIYKEDQIYIILQDDGYRKLNSGEAPIQGDLVIYKHPLHGFIHAGIFMEKRFIGNAPIHWILSKWSDSFGEDLHSLEDVPNNYEGYEIEFWTDRL